MLLHPLSEIMGRIFEAEQLPTSLGRVIMADRPDLADVQCNGALQAAKLAGKKPRDIADSIVARLNVLPEAKDIFADIAIAGPGFINIRLTPTFLARQLSLQAEQEKYGLLPVAPQTYLIEYISPNLGKAMHIGHLRNAMIGDAVRRLVAYTGHKVITDNHLGDWGLPMGQILSETQRRYPDLPFFHDDYDGSYTGDIPISFQDLAEIYPAASQKAKDDPEELKRAQLMTAALQDGHPGYRALWQHFMTLSVADMNKTLDAFGVPRFDTYYGESYMDPFIPKLIEEMKEKSILTKVEGGALGIDVSEEGDKFERPPLILVKSMGGVTYSTTDIATFYQRQKDFDPDVCIVVTDFRQELHFERVYRAAKRAGYANRMRFVHLMYGTINDTSGKPYKTRSGATPSFAYLTDIIYGKAAERLTEIGLDKKLSPELFDETKRLIGLASLKFGDLINHRRSDYVFDLDKFVSFEGKTGPYVQYTVVRLNALLQKATEQGMEKGAFKVEDTQRDIALLLLQFPSVIESALGDYAPNLLCDYLFRLAQAVNRFYQTVPVLIEEDHAKRAAALAFMDLSARILTQGLDLVGIQVPKQM